MSTETVSTGELATRELDLSESARAPLVERLPILFAKLPLAAGITLINATIVAVVVAPVVSAERVVSWWVAIVAVSLARWSMAGRIGGANLRDRDTRRLWLVRFRWGTCVAGVLWGLMGLVLFPRGELAYQLFLAFVIAGMAGASVTTLAADLLSVRLFLTLAILPLAVRLAWEFDSLHLAMAIMTALYWVGLNRSARIGYDAIVALYRVKDRDRQLVQQKRRFAQRLIDAQEQERRRISRELHDDLGQSLTAIKLVSRQLIAHPGDEVHVERHATELRRLTDTMIDSVRALSRGLRPPVLDDLGVAAAIESLTRNYSGAECECHIAPQTSTISGQLATTIYRIAQEALTNAARHAKAKHVVVRLDQTKDGWLLEISDDGCGVSKDAIDRTMALGIQNMTERAALMGGELTIEAPAAGGTCVRAVLPPTIPPDLGDDGRSDTVLRT